MTLTHRTPDNNHNRRHPAMLALLALLIGCLRAWRDWNEPLRALFRPRAWGEAIAAAFSLKYLANTGAGCSVSDSQRSGGRRLAHHLTFYGFLLCFAATLVATLYHYGFGWHAPYGYTSLPVALGTLGGIGLVIGPPLLYWHRRRADPAIADPAHDGSGSALIVLLMATSLTGLLLLALRETTAMALLLIVHLAVVMALFATLPYGKFVHGFYRLCALVKYALERRRPRNMSFGGESF